jgi:PPOX class probable F420-dependent enzyme
MAELSPQQIAFLRDNAYVGVLTTIRADGTPHSTVVWVDVGDEGRPGFNTAYGRFKTRNIARDPRVTLTVVNPGDAYQWLSVTGIAELVDDGADAQIDRLAAKYLGVESYPNRTPDEVRVSVPITPARIEAKGIG